MMYRLAHSLRSRFRNSPGRLRDNDRGVVSVEFAFTVPIILLMYIGLVQVSLIVSTDRQVSQSASTLADLASQATANDEGDMTAIMTAGLQVLQVSNPDVRPDIAMQITSCERDNNDVYDVMGTATLAGSNFTFPPVDCSSIDPRLLVRNGGVVVSRVRYDFKMLSNGSGSTINTNRALINYNVELGETFVMKPRVSTKVAFRNTADTSSDFTCTADEDYIATCS